LVRFGHHEVQMPQTITALPSTADPLLKQEEVAERFRDVNVRTLERWRSIGFGPAFVKLGRRVFYRASDVEAWIAQQRREHTAV
jgi:predicted DNA-binding transcriptional regulator AlpA